MNVITETPSSVLTFLESPLKGFVGARCCSGKKAPSSGARAKKTAWFGDQAPSSYARRAPGQARGRGLARATLGACRGGIGSEVSGDAVKTVSACRPPHREHTTPSRQSRTGVWRRSEVAISAGSGLDLMPVFGR